MKFIHHLFSYRRTTLFNWFLLAFYFLLSSSLVAENHHSPRDSFEYYNIYEKAGMDAGIWAYVIESKVLNLLLHLDLSKTSDPKLLDFRLAYRPRFFGVGGLRICLGRKKLDLGLSDVELADPRFAPSYFKVPGSPEESWYLSIRLVDKGLLEKGLFQPLYIPIGRSSAISPIYLNPAFRKSPIKESCVLILSELSLVFDPRLDIRGNWKKLQKD